MVDSNSNAIAVLIAENLSEDEVRRHFLGMRGNQGHTQINEPLSPGVEGVAEEVEEEDQVVVVVEIQEEGV
ncbi:hypothetical protein E2C01_028795 [Portunus trituberculatus]|uniref:Uncharacterized protein n=1 Tax=Portunus trituberculatus TaxID=210409 RepID=A0A5B7EQZ6_PORTR|nr:hypothetical protein [Portunus trituberculatus]